MFSYRNRIQLETHMNSEISLSTDRGDRVQAFQIVNSTTPVTRWWEYQHASDLRRWQKDVLIGEIGRQSGLPDLFVLYRKGHGERQCHDLMLIYQPVWQLWILSTGSDTWIQSESDFLVKNSMGSILDPAVRQQLYGLIPKINRVMHDAA